MIRVGGGGNDPEFLRWLFIRLVLGLLWRIVWHGLTYWPRRAWHSIQKRVGAPLTQRADPDHR